MPPLDLKQFRTLTLGDAAAERDILGEFRSSTPRDEAELRAALARADWTALGQSAHRIKGAAWVIAAMELVAACAAIEAASKTDPPSVPCAQIAAFDLAIGRVYERIDEMLSDAGKR